MFWLKAVIANTFLQKYESFMEYIFCTYIFKCKGGKKPPEVMSAKTYAQWNPLHDNDAFWVLWCFL